MKNLINENYKISGIPSGKEVLKQVNLKKGAELVEYIAGLEKLRTRDKESMYLSAYETIHNQIHENVKHPPKFEVKEATKRKLEEILEDVQTRLQEVVSDINSTIEANPVINLSKLSLEEARREVSRDGLCAFMEFENDHKKVSFKLHKKIPTHHNANITCILNLGNKYIATGSRNGAIKVYQLSTSNLVAEFNEHSDVVTCLCSISLLDSKNEENFLLCSGSANLDGRILVWNIFKGEESFVGITGHVGTITALASLEDGRTLASAAHDGNIILWDTKTKEEVFRTVAHGSMISALRYSPGQKRVFSAGWDSNIKIWNVNNTGVKDGYLRKSLSLANVIVSDTPIVNLLIRQVKGNYIVSIGANNTIKVWNSETGLIEGDFASADNSRAEVCLLENKFKYGKADFITLNTAVKEDLVH